MAPKQDRTCKLGLHCSVAPGCAFTHLTTQTSHTKYIYEVLIHIDVKNICLYLKGSGHTLFLSLSFSPLAHPNVAWMTHSKVPITGLLPSLHAPAACWGPGTGALSVPCRYGINGNVKINALFFYLSVPICPCCPRLLHEHNSTWRHRISGASGRATFHLCHSWGTLINYMFTWILSKHYNKGLPEKQRADTNPDFLCCLMVFTVVARGGRSADCDAPHWSTRQGYVTS